LLIQIPFVNQSSVVVLEGDYRHSFSKEVCINMEYVDSGEIKERDLNDVMLTDLSLLQFSNQYKYPFSNRLIEYLLNNVMSYQDEIGNNIAPIQECLPSQRRDAYVSGVWN